MSGESSSAAAWSTLLEPAPPQPETPRRPDDPRLGEIVDRWQADPSALLPNRAVLIGFPQDEGVRRNHGREGAAAAPDEVRRWLYRLTTGDPRGDVDLARRPPLDLGNVRITGPLEESQQALAEVVAAVLQAGAVPVVLGGGHETAWGHYLGYVRAGVPLAIVNIDAHLDVRSCAAGAGHSGSPFYQALEHPTRPLPGDRYICLGAQPHAVSRSHYAYARAAGCVVHWRDEGTPLRELLAGECERLAKKGCRVYVTVDADAVCAADVPGVSAPNALGFAGAEVAACARFAGRATAVASLDLVEINPRHDRDGQSARWAAATVWNFLVGLAARH